MFIDISRTISPESVVFPGDESLRFVQLDELGPDSSFAKIGFEGFSGHVMSHVDVPNHVIEKGKSLDDYEVSDFVFDAVVHAVEGDVIDAAVIAGVGDARGKAVLFKTRGSQVGDTDPFAEDFVYITGDGAEALVAAGVAAVGIDYLSVDSLESDAAHRALMREDILVFEALQFRDAVPGNYRLFAFPLKIKGGDGSPVRAVLQSA